MPKRVAVTGGGMGGPAAAVCIRDSGPWTPQIVLYDQSETLGGKLCTGEPAGTLVAGTVSGRGDEVMCCLPSW